MAQTAAAPGGLIAAGTTALPITLTSGAASPAAGSWGGVYFNPTADPTSTLSNAVVMYAGQEFAPLRLFRSLLHRHENLRVARGHPGRNARRGAAVHALPYPLPRRKPAQVRGQRELYQRDRTPCRRLRAMLLR
jgi:hypothetical protein